MTAAPPMPPDEHDVVEPLLAAHALATLEAHDADRVELHLASCAACRVTFDELCAASAAVEVIAHDAVVEACVHGDPPATMRAEVLARARTTPQYGAAAQAEPAAAQAPARPSRPARGRRWLQRLNGAIGAAAALGVVVAALLVNAHDDRERIASLEDRLRDARGDHVQVLHGGQFETPREDQVRARVTLDREAGRIVFRDVAAPPRDMVWQVWQVDDERRIRRLGVIREATDAAALPLEGIDADELERVFITTEPAEAGADEPGATDLEEGSA